MMKEEISNGKRGFIQCPYFFDDDRPETRCVFRFNHETGHAFDPPGVGNGRITWWLDPEYEAYLRLLDVDGNVLSDPLPIIKGEVLWVPTEAEPKTVVAADLLNDEGAEVGRVVMDPVTVAAGDTLTLQMDIKIT